MSTKKKTPAASERNTPATRKRAASEPPLSRAAIDQRLASGDWPSGDDDAADDDAADDDSVDE